MEDVRLAVAPGALRLLKQVQRLLAEDGTEAYLVGGFVRDMLLSRDTADIDIAVSAGAPAVARKCAAALGGKYVALDAEHGVGRVVVPGEGCYLDFSTLAGGIRDDLARRDFTIDAIALPLDAVFEDNVNADRLIDPFGGRADLRRRVLRATGPGVFAADAVRLLRAVRLAAELGLDIEAPTGALIRRDSRLITTVAGERVREELLRLLALPGAGPRLEYLDSVGLLTALVPELEPARGVGQPPLHVWDVLTHSLRMVAAVEFLLRQGGWDYAGPDTLAAVPWSPALEEHFGREISHGSPRRVMLKVAALLHDIAKPATKTVDPDGRSRFLGHPVEGAAAAAAVMSRLRFSRREIEHVGLLIKYHLRPTQMTHEELPTRRAVYRYFRDTGEAGIDLLYLSLADHLATRGPTLDPEQWRGHTALTGFVLGWHDAEAGASRPAGLIDGNDLMKHFRLGPGPQVGSLLEAVREARAAGEVNDKRGALRYAGRLLAGGAGPKKK